MFLDLTSQQLRTLVLSSPVANVLVCITILTLDTNGPSPSVFSITPAAAKSRTKACKYFNFSGLKRLYLSIALEFGSIKG